MSKIHVNYERRILIKSTGQISRILFTEMTLWTMEGRMCPFFLFAVIKPSVDTSESNKSTATFNFYYFSTLRNENCRVTEMWGIMKFVYATIILALGAISSILASELSGWSNWILVGMNGKIWEPCRFSWSKKIIF